MAAYSKTWIRFGVQGKRARDPKDGRGWRCFVEGCEEVPLHNWHLDGTLLRDVNFKACIDPTEQNPGELVAWVAVFGDIYFSDDDATATVFLRDPR
jgi:hypothetical protein